MFSISFKNVIIIVFFCFFKIIYATSYRIPSLIQQSNITVPVIDPCRYFQIENSTLFRMGRSNIISRWDLNSMTYNQQDTYQSSIWAYNVANLGLGKITSELTVPLANTKNFDILTAQNIQFSSSQINSTSSTYYLSKVESTSIQYLELLSSNTLFNHFNIYNKTFSLISSISLNFSGPMNSTLSKDQKTIVLYNYKGYALMYCRTTSWGFCGWATPPTASQAMNGVTLSNNGSIALFEYDSVFIGLLVVKIVPLQNASLISSKTFTNTVINQAIFMDSDCHLLAVTINYTYFQIYDTLTLTLLSNTNLIQVSNYSAIDYSLGRLYLCLQQSVQVYQIYCSMLTYRSSLTNQCIDCVLQNNCLGCDQATGFCNSCQTNFSLNTTSFLCQVQILINSNTNITNSNDTDITNNTSNSSDNSVNSTNSTVTNNTNSTNINGTNSTNATNSTNNNTNWLNNNASEITKSTENMSTIETIMINTQMSGLMNLSPILGFIYMILEMTPFAILFLSFINYWNFCCLYSILDIKVPSYLPEAHQIIFNSTQTSIFTVLNYDPQLPVLDSQMIQQNFAVNYQISLDFINAYYQNIFVILFVLALVSVLIILRNWLIPKQTFLFKCLKFHMLQSIFGQLITFSPFCIIPYKFLISNASYRIFKQKINLLLQTLLFIGCLSVISLYIWKRSQQYKKIKYQKQKQQNKNNIIQIEKSKYKEIQFQRQLLEVIANITVPFFIILPTYLPFFIVNFVIFSYGIKKAVQSQNYRMNRIITSIYLPLYHTCYLIFYLFKDNQKVIQYTGLFCLTILLLGGIHQLASFVIINSMETILWLIKSCKKSKIQAQQNQHQQIFYNVSTPVQIQKKFIESKPMRIKRSFINEQNKEQVKIKVAPILDKKIKRFTIQHSNFKTFKLKRVKAVANKHQLNLQQQKNSSQQFVEATQDGQKSFNYSSHSKYSDSLKIKKKTNSQINPSNIEENKSFFKIQHKNKRKREINKSEFPNLNLIELELQCWDQMNNAQNNNLINFCKRISKLGNNKIANNYQNLHYYDIQNYFILKQFMNQLQINKNNNLSPISFICLQQSSIKQAVCFQYYYKKQLKLQILNLYLCQFSYLINQRQKCKNVRLKTQRLTQIYDMI